jgi:hypothetical protein
VVASLFFLPTLLPSFHVAPLFVRALWALAGGWFVSGALVIHVADDLRSGWCDRALGVSHREFIQIYEILAACFTVVLVLWFFLLSHLSLDGLRLGIIAATPTLIMPWLSLQIDGRRPLINSVVMVLGSLFLGSAILAHWFGLLLFPLVRSYAHQSQAGRYYRA